ncbi:MAG: type II toxin-antitoxin system Phd/YefM family antitoxin [Anaerorhabdus sp.]
MTTTNATNLRKNLYETLDTTIKYNETITVNTKYGNAIIISEDEYNSLVETVYLTSLPNYVKEIKKADKEPMNKCKKYIKGEEW